MKTYEDLSEAELEKLRTFWLIKGNLQLRAGMLCVPAFIGIIIGVALAGTGYIPLLISGILTFAFSMVYVAVILFQLQTDEKVLFLSFGMTNSMTDMFDIKRSDIMDLRRTWKKVEK